MAVGRFLVDGEDQVDEGDDQRFRTVIVLGSRVAEELFPFEDVIGQTVVLNKEQYVVIGVIKERTPRGTSSAGSSQEDSTRTCTFRSRPARSASARRSSSARAAAAAASRWSCTRSR